MSGEHRTSVGHTKADPTDEYVGRGPAGRHIHTTDEIGDRGWLGNPYALDDGYSREESIAQFREDFEHRLEHDEEFRGAVRELAGKTLGCWCQHLDDESPACHAEVIAEHADRLAEEQPAVTDGGTPAEAVDHWAGKCPNCGPIADVEVEFPEGGVCGECGAELDRIAVLDEAQAGVGS